MNVFSALLCFFISMTAYANSPVGTFMIVKGEVTVIHSDGKSEKARMGLKVFPKDIIQTLKDARGKIVMIDKNVINLSPESKLQIQDYTFKPEESKKSVLLNLMYGKVRPQVNQKYDEKDNTFRVKTTAAVAGVRGTDFIVSFQNNRSEIITFSGLVNVGTTIDTSNQIVSPVGVAAGQGTSVTTTTGPQTPTNISAAQLASLDKESSGDGKTEENRQPAQGNPPTNNKEEKKQEPSPSAATPRSPQAIPTTLPPPPPPPVNEVPVLPGPIASAPITMPTIPLPVAPPVNPIVGDIIQQTNTSVNVIIVGP